MLKKQMEGELAEAKEALRRSHELNEMLNRRIELLEDTLRRERAARGDAEPLEPRAGAACADVARVGRGAAATRRHRRRQRTARQRAFVGWRGRL